MTPADEIARVAAGLSEAQRRALGDAYYGQGGWRVVYASRALVKKGILHPPGSLRLTPLGLSIRALLEQERRDG